MDLASIRSTYRFYAPFYDLFFGSVVDHGRRVAVERLPAVPGSRILEIGVGTGLSLPHYSPEVRVTGIDVSPDMLAKARREYPNSRYPAVQDLLEMDAQDLQFPDDSFDAVVAMYVASVVPDPLKMMREMARVCAPGGSILVLNHFASDRGGMKLVENVMSPFSRKIGFRPDFSLDAFLQMAGLELVKITRVNLGGYWKLVEFRNLSIHQKNAARDGIPPVGSNGRHGLNGNHGSNGSSKVHHPKPVHDRAKAKA
jgi:phosphatidylethanolamine/phosphatidyl-N-methylethanolamine N-methyltransferase